ncbi:MAG: helix-turn-helix domain-containing protein [Pusillimonas sp.]|nr:helix-turn-helix domain-containing protein [Pusillimonas sp.]
MKPRHTSAHVDTLDFPVHDPPVRSYGTFVPSQCAASIAGACSASKLCRNGVDALHRTPPVLPLDRRSIRRGASLYRAGDAFTHLYQLYSGSVKLRIVNQSGVEQIAAFPMAGALLGLDGIETGKYTCDVVALEHVSVCALSVADVLALCSHDAEATLLFSKLIAHETTYYRNLLLVLASMKSDERIANFLLELSGQMAARGYSRSEFTLKMTREDIANHLGMKLETVSRILTRLKVGQILDVRRRHLKIRDFDALRRIGNGSCE